MGVRQRLRYRFDNLMARGVGAQILLLAVFTALLIATTVVLLYALGVVPADDQGVHDSTGKVVWRSLNRTLDPGNLSNDSGSWTFLLVMLFATLGGVFVVSALFGVINQGFGSALDRMRRGKSAVVERDHVVILGWNPKIATLLRELGEANRHHRGACVVLLADRDKLEMDSELAHVMHGHLRVVTRSGSPMSLTDLQLVGLPTSKAVIVLAPEEHTDGTPMAAHESDTVVLKALLALAKSSANQEQPLHIIAEIFDERTEPIARLVTGDKAALILAAPLISRLLVQTGRQSGLSAVYTELLDFEGVEIYFATEPKLTGKTFREAVFAYNATTVIGVLDADGKLHVPPALDRKFSDGDQLIAISEDDDSIRLDGGAEPDAALVVARPDTHVHPAERTLVLGTSRRLPMVLRELDTHMSPGSEVHVYGEQGAGALGDVQLDQLRNTRVTIAAGDITNRGFLDGLDVTSFDHVLVLSETHDRTHEMSDARTTVTLLYLRDLERIAGKKVPITSEILDIHNRDLAAVAEADDFIVSNTLVSLMVSQVAENKHLVELFDELFTAGGFELYLKPAHYYVKPGDVTFATISEAALRRNEVAIGYRLAKHAKNPDISFGVVINPAKRATVALGDGDRVIVLSEG
jgi:voltage-gated potassium channel Kch